MRQTKSSVRLEVKTSYILILLVLISTLLATSLYFRFHYFQSQGRLDLYQKTYTLHTSNVGDILDTKAFSFAVTKVEYDDKGVTELPAAPGMKFVMVSVSLYNKSDSTVYFLPILETYMQDSTGTRYEITTAPKIETESIAGPIMRARGYDGDLGYMVPKDAKGLEFVYEPKAFPNSNTIIYRIDN